MNQRVKAFSLCDEVVGWQEHSCLNPPGLQGSQPIRARADLHERDILHRNQSELFKSHAREKIGAPAEGNGKRAPFQRAAVLISGRLMSQYSWITVPPAIITASAPLRLALTAGGPVI